MATLNILFADGLNISNITGLEHATSLTNLNLFDNSISDISAISARSGFMRSELTNLTDLWLFNNPLSAKSHRLIPYFQATGVRVFF